MQIPVRKVFAKVIFHWMCVCIWVCVRSVYVFECLQEGVSCSGWHLLDWQSASWLCVLRIFWACLAKVWMHTTNSEMYGSHPKYSQKRHRHPVRVLAFYLKQVLNYLYLPGYILARHTHMNSEHCIHYHMIHFESKRGQRTAFSIAVDDMNVPIIYIRTNYINHFFIFSADKRRYTPTLYVYQSKLWMHLILIL